MKVVLYKNGKPKDITNLVQTVTWSGDKTQVARKLEINMLHPNTDKNIPKVEINCGDILFLYEDSEELFRGHVFSKEKTQSSEVTQITAYDSLIYLTKSKGCYNIKKMTPEAVTRKVCKDFNILVGGLPNTNIIINNLFKDKSIYEIIQTCYTKARWATGYKYIQVMNKGYLNVIIKGAKTIKYNANYVVDTENTETIENMVNRIKVYDDKENYIGTVENSSWVKAYGVIQAIETASSKKDMNSAIKSKLHGIDKATSLSGIGNIQCITGNAISISVADGISGLFYIDGDTHTWQNGMYTMQLTLDYQNIMDEVYDTDIPEDTVAKKGSNKKAKRQGALAKKKAAAVKTSALKAIAQNTKG